LSLKLYLDDCAYSRRLCQLLREAGHDVETPADLAPPLLGADDAAHFAHARAAGRAILTLNARDFKALHDRDAAHAGILVVYQDNDASKDMRYADIVRAIANLERSVPQVAGGFWVLNLYRW
jgi:hypothetical protein